MSALAPSDSKPSRKPLTFGDYFLMLIIAVVAWPVTFVASYFGLAMAIGRFFHATGAVCSEDQYSSCGSETVLWLAALALVAATAVTVLALVVYRAEVSPVTEPRGAK